MPRFFDFLIVLSILTWLLGLGLGGLLSAEVIGFSLVGLVVLMSLARRLEMGLASSLLRVGVVIASLVTLVIVYGEGSPQGSAPFLAALVELVLILLGISIIVGGVGRRR